MKIFYRIKQLKEELNKIKTKKIGLVPTMGYLHDGHLSLIKKSLYENDITVVSIFVNPAQFAPHEDLDVYPRDFKKDTRLLKDLKVDFLFHPSNEEMYKKDHLTFVKVKEFSDLLCGTGRPNHFEGVTTIVLKLFNIISPHNAYCGQKDAQQAIIIKKMIIDLNLDINIRVLPIIRERDGLALSSRNKYLSSDERKIATHFYRSLSLAKKAINEGELNPDKIILLIKNNLNQKGLLKIEYIIVLNIHNLLKQKQIDPQNTLVAGAIKIGKTRLIDNFILGEI